MTQPTTAPAPTPPRGRGRPALPAGEGRQSRIELRTTAELADKAERMAKLAGLSVSAWIEQRIRSAR